MESFITFSLRDIGIALIVGVAFMILLNLLRLVRELSQYSDNSPLLDGSKHLALATIAG
ncbi:MAG TPA: hypothetical protein VGI65_21035 [Steroidobacteraceae bacterium]|jgi:hypothetical protein